MSTEKILVIDDEQDALDFLTYNLENEGYEVRTATDGKLGINAARTFRPDLILLDVMMPDLDGIEVCRQLRDDASFDDTLIAFLTARGEDYTHVAALDYGGDDFIVKPIRPTVLKSRIAALLRRSRSGLQKDGDVMVLGDLTLYRDRFEVAVCDQIIELAKKEFQVLELLMSAPGKVFSRQEIFHRVWGSNIIVGERTIDVHVRRIREKIGASYIKTLKGVGYKIEI